jgi:Ca-activated chloride channel family protein
MYPKIISLFLIFSMITSGCSSLLDNLAGKSETVEIIYGSEKQEWLDPLIKSFNDLHAKTKDGYVIKIVGTPMGSIESVDAILSGKLQPTVWSPASSLYIPVANEEWRKTHSDDIYSENPKDLVLSPVVIAMWKPMAEALGWPEKALGWSDIANLAISENGWSDLGYPEWGSFKFGHTHPNFSNSGLVSVIAQAYAGSQKQKGLSLSDLEKPELVNFVSQVQTSIIHYGSSTGFFATRMFDRGPSYLSASVLYENLVVTQEVKRLNGQSSQLPVVAIYPKEGTFWANHPYVILNATWVTPVQQEGAKLFRDYLLDKPQQQTAIQFGFRPADPSIALSTPLDTLHGVDIQQPKTVLEIPSAQVIEGVLQLWKKVKKPVDLVLAIDTSGSMAGEKIASARSSLLEFVRLLDERDRLQIVTFNSRVNILTPLSEVGSKRADLLRRIGGIVEGGNTTLYDAAEQSITILGQDGDVRHIRSVVLLSDGQDTASATSLNELLSVIGPKGEEGGNSIKLFTVAFGDDADSNTLKKMAEITGGKQYNSDPQTIMNVYSDIATFF